MGFSEIIGRRVRLGDWQDQKISTYRKIHEALDEGRFEDASELAAYFVDEGKVCWVLYRQWILDLEGFLTDEGMTADELAAVTEQIVNAIVLPDGRPFDSDAHWVRFNELVGEVTTACAKGDAAGAKPAMDEAKEIWRQTHDRDVDHTYGLMSAVCERFGTDRVVAGVIRVESDRPRAGEILRCALAALQSPYFWRRWIRCVPLAPSSRPIPAEFTGM
jgi:hypothetical protein